MRQPLQRTRVRFCVPAAEWHPDRGVDDHTLKFSWLGRAYLYDSANSARQPLPQCRPRPVPAEKRTHGEGAMPDWLQRAVNAGQSMEDFRISVGQAK